MLQSGGAAFISNNLVDAKPNQKRQFAQVVARRITEGLVNVEFEKDCTCEQHRGLAGRAHCKIVNRKEKEQLAVRIFVYILDETNIWYKKKKHTLTTIADRLVQFQYVNLSYMTTVFYAREKHLNLTHNYRDQILIYLIYL